MSAVLAEFCRSIHRLYWLLISSLGYSVLTIGLICIVLGLTLPVYLLRDIIRNSLGVCLRWLNWLSILLIGLRLLRSLLVLYRVRIFLQWRGLSSPGCRPEQSDLPDLPDQWA